ncbi:MAG: helix-turn-helix transcriptional regulator [Firmicutes bacterium]|nr:helix-turn-helix transcriptional regulator [Bacillota bacterium]
MADSLILTLIFTWILLYPLHGPFLGLRFGPQAHIQGHIFALSHGAGLLIFAFLPPPLTQKAKILKGAGVAVFLLTGVWTFIPPPIPVTYVLNVLLGFLSAYLVLAWTPLFMNPHYPALRVGLAMVSSNVFLGLAGLAQGFPPDLLKNIASLLGLAPLYGAYLMGKKSEAAAASSATGTHQRNQLAALPGKRVEAATASSAPETDGGKGAAGLALAFLLAYAAAAYFSGGFWYRVVAPLFYFHWPQFPGADSFLYSAAVLGYASLTVKYKFFNWLGATSVGLLGAGLAFSVIGLDKPLPIVATLIFLTLGLGATDLFYWLSLRALGKYLGPIKSFGLGLGASLFFLTLPGIALDLRLLQNPPGSPLVAVLGVVLLFLLVPFLGRFRPPLGDVKTDENNLAGDGSSQPPPFWFNLTNQEKKVYELLCRGYTYPEIASRLFVSHHTVKFHTRNILRKAGAANRKELLGQKLFPGGNQAFDSGISKQSSPEHH